MLLRIVQISLVNSLAAPTAFVSLRHISYPTMILAKSCKLVPVMLMNVLLYRRRFLPHKYIVVGLVTFGISLFMLSAPAKKGQGAESGSLLGLALLLVSLLLDGATNSGQDEVFARFKISGSQMMFWMNLCSTTLLSLVLVTPLPPLPAFLGVDIAPARTGPELLSALAFIRVHPAVLSDILAFSLAGALGQLFIFDTLEHFGSLTLVTITVTRKLFTMLLSVAVFGHTLGWAQWLAVGVVFAGIGVEASVKRKEGVVKRVVVEEKERAGIKSL
jgi:solute carrier family 35 (UDP-galactose transporter), member B1